MILYSTDLGCAHLGDAFSLMDTVPNETVDLVLTSPPFALQRPKEYGNVAPEEYVDWLLPYCQKLHRILKPTGSLVLDLGGSYKKGQPIRSLHNYRLLLRLCDELGFHLAQEFYWHNPAKLPSPIEWVVKQKVRAKDAVNTIWWLSKTEHPKANTQRVLSPYSPRMLQELRKAHSSGSMKRPSGHKLNTSIFNNNGGSLPSNLLTIANTESNSAYQNRCRAEDIRVHPARFPIQLPEFFIQFLTDEGDLVLDIFAGSNTTGAAAERLNRRWLAFEIEAEYLKGSAFRFFLENEPESNDGLQQGRLFED